MPKPSTIRRNEAAYRLEGYVQHVNHIYPGLFKDLQKLRDDARNWPEWCYAPMNVLFGPMSNILTEANRRHQMVQSHELTQIILHDTAMLSALSGWRLGKNLCEFDPELEEALWNTSIKGQIPVEVLLALPAYCLYVQFSKPRIIIKREIKGFFIHLDMDGNGRPELRFLLDNGEVASLWPFPIILKGTLEESLEILLQNVAEENRLLSSSGIIRDIHAIYREAVEPLLSLTLYLCSKNSEWEGEYKEGKKIITLKERPHSPTPKEIRRAQHDLNMPTLWRLGKNIGQNIIHERKAYQKAVQDAQSQEDGKRKSPIPHIRKAHWHTYLTGNRDNPSPETRWIPLTYVMAHKAEEIPVTVRKVR